MNGILPQLWLIPFLPLLAAGVIAILPSPRRKLAAGLAIGAMGASFLLALAAFFTTLGGEAGSHGPAFYNITWLQFSYDRPGILKLGWILDPLTAVMLVMVTFVGLLIFIYSIGYMAHDPNFSQFFCFLSLFAGAMLGVVLANSLLLLFMCWELVGLASYLLIGFWYQKPSAAAAAKKAFITTRVGDIGLFLGMIWLYGATGTLLFYDDGGGCLEKPALAKLVAGGSVFGMGTATAISLLLFCGAAGKSGQVPLHVWLPDAMEGPTPVSALIHAATMVAAGVFLVARVFPLMGAMPPGSEGVSTALTVVTWVGAITAVFAACIAVAQDDIKRILAYSTVSQLGYMMLGLGVGGVAVGMFHLITHAFFKALLFLGSGSVIHGCREEQDIRHMGGLRWFMPVTFVTYGIGMCALSGVPLVFSGFWSKDEILHSAHGWPVSHGPFYLALFGALLTAFYMTRQMFYVFFGSYRGQTPQHATARAVAPGGADGSGGHLAAGGEHHDMSPHESPAVMTVPLVILAAFAVLLGFLGTPAWPWFHAYLSGHSASFEPGRLGSALPVMLLSTAVVGLGMGMGWFLYGRRPILSAASVDALERIQPGAFGLLRKRLLVDEAYEATVLAWHAGLSRLSDFLDRVLWGGLVSAVTVVILGLSWASRLFDEYVLNLVFDRGCERVRRTGDHLSLLHGGQVQRYLRLIGLALTGLVLLMTWGCHAS
jgi:NADH-quinone oxidoreductase subunit L